MGISAITLWEESSDSARVDRHPQGCCVHDQQVTAGRRDSAGGNGEVLSATLLAEKTQATPEIIQDEVGRHRLWFALSEQQRAQFGSHFSEMLLRAVLRQVCSA